MDTAQYSLDLYISACVWNYSSFKTIVSETKSLKLKRGLHVAGTDNRASRKPPVVRLPIKAALLRTFSSAREHSVKLWLKRVCLFKMARFCLYKKYVLIQIIREECAFLCSFILATETTVTSFHSLMTSHSALYWVLAAAAALLPSK